MNYTKYSNLTDDELLVEACTTDGVSPLALELAQRLTAALEEIEDLVGGTSGLAKFIAEDD